MMKKEMLFAGLIIGFVANSALAMKNPERSEVGTQCCDSIEIIKATVNQAAPKRFVKAKKRPVSVWTRNELMRPSKSGNMYEFVDDIILLPSQKMRIDKNFIHCRYAIHEYGELDVIIQNGVSCNEFNGIDFMYLMKQQREMIKK